MKDKGRRITMVSFPVRQASQDFSRKRDDNQNGWFLRTWDAI